jgi:hypothetical protein
MAESGGGEAKVGEGPAQAETEALWALIVFSTACGVGDRLDQTGIAREAGSLACGLRWREKEIKCLASKDQESDTHTATWSVPTPRESSSTRQVSPEEAGVVTAVVSTGEGGVVTAVISACMGGVVLW